MTKSDIPSEKSSDDRVTGSPPDGDAFYAHFGEHVLPRLKNLIVAEARVVACNQQSFLDAWTACMTYARRHGARHFSDARHQSLGDWVTDALCWATLRAEDEGWAP